MSNATHDEDAYSQMARRFPIGSRVHHHLHVNDSWPYLGEVRDWCPIRNQVVVMTPDGALLRMAAYDLKSAGRDMRFHDRARLKPGWIEREFQQASDEVATWPEWMKNQ